MKKVLALLSLAAFLVVSVNAQTTQSSAPVEKKETSVVKADAKSASAKSCCVKANASCCKNNKDAKNCTAEQKAACAKSGKECSAHASVSNETKPVKDIKKFEPKKEANADLEIQ